MKLPLKLFYPLKILANSKAKYLCLFQKLYWITIWYQLQLWSDCVFKFWVWWSLVRTLLLIWIFYKDFVNLLSRARIKWITLPIWARYINIHRNTPKGIYRSHSNMRAAKQSYIMWFIADVFISDSLNCSVICFTDCDTNMMTSINKAGLSNKSKWPSSFHCYL